MNSDEAKVSPVVPPGLKKIPSYWYPYTTMAKGRWLGRELLEVVSTEFRDRSMEYYRYALESGVTTVNGKVAEPHTIIQNGDRIENIVHRHEPPVTSTPVKILHHDKEREFIVVDKPGSIPVHASGRYFRNSLVEILQNEFGFDKVYTVNRLDRLTSGLMIVPLSSNCARRLTEEFTSGSVRKEYIARCKGEFPDDTVVCEQPLLTVDRQMGLNIVHPEGKHAKTIFRRIHYDPSTDTSVLHCQPLTGRSHQIRVHLQYLGHPIANDSVYSETRIWVSDVVPQWPSVLINAVAKQGPSLGKGGIDLTPSDQRSAPVPPTHLEAVNSPESLKPSAIGDTSDITPSRKLLPRETGHDIGMGSPVLLSEEAVGVITRLRNMKDENEDWSRWRDIVFRAKGSLAPKGIRMKPMPPQNKRERGGPAFFDVPPGFINGNDTKASKPDNTHVELSLKTDMSTCEGLPAEQLTEEEALEKAHDMDQTAVTADGILYCPECYLPLHPDPKPEKLYIFLHALRYTTSLGCFETNMPGWAAEGWIWDHN